MSRGTETQKIDELCAVYAIGEAINLLAREQMDSLYGGDYEAARNGVTEDMAFALKNMVNNYYNKSTRT